MNYCILPSNNNYVTLLTANADTEPKLTLLIYEIICFSDS